MSTRSCFAVKSLHVLVAAGTLLASVFVTEWIIHVRAAQPAAESASAPAAPFLSLASLPGFDSPLPPPPGGSGDEGEPVGPTPTDAEMLGVGEVVTDTIDARGTASVRPDGVTTLRFPRGAVRRAASVRITRLAELPAPLPRGVRYKGYGLDVQIRGRGDGRPIHKMEQPVTIVMRYSGLPGLGNATSQRLLKLYRYNEQQGEWKALPTRVSPGTGVLTATTTGFSRVVPGADTTVDLGDYAEPWSPTVQDFQVDLFTGATTWNVPIDVPVGRGGLAPSLGLSYSSGIVDGMRTKLNPQASWVGAGWNLGVGYIARAIERDENRTPMAVPTYTLVFNGVSSELVHVGGEQYRTKDERYWRVERVTTGAQNQGNDYWLVTTRDGIQYRFGYADETAGGNDSDINSAWWMMSQNPDPNDETLYSFNWRWNLDQIEDTHGNLVRFEYHAEHNDFYYLKEEGGELHRYFYSDESPCGAGQSNCPNYPYYDHWALDSGYVAGGYLKRITYSEHDQAPAAYEVVFDEEPRHDYPNTLDSDVTETPDIQTFWNKHRLETIDVKHASGDLIRRYELDLDYLSYDQDDHYATILEGVQQFDAQGGSLPPTTFTYHGQMPSYYDCMTGYNWNCDLLGEGYDPEGRGMKAWLNTAHTGYGGSVNFNYIMEGFQSGQVIDPNRDVVGVGPNGEILYRYWFRYRVRGVTADPGIGPDVFTEYRYCKESGNCTTSGACTEYGTGTGDVHCGYWDNEEFRGHPRVRMIQREGQGGAAVAYSDHYFHQGDDDATGSCDGSLTDLEGMEGREYKVVHYAPGGAEMARTVTRYKRKLYGEDWHFIYPKAVCQYPAGQGGPEVKTWYDVDNYGNVTTERHHGDTAVSGDERLVRRGYLYNTDGWILDRPAWQRVYDGLPSDPPDGTEVAMQAWAYDGLGLGAPPTQGDATLGAAYHTISADWQNPAHYYATQYEFDGWGNVITTTNALGQVATTAFDDTYEQFPVETCSAVGTSVEQSTQIDYYGANDPNGLFGQVKRVTDANGAVTGFRYDTFGRLVKVKAHDDPGWNAGQVTARYAYSNLGQVGKQRVVAWSGRDDTWQETFFDGLGRTVQVHALADGGQEVRTTTGYDALGRALKVWAPTYGTHGENGGYGAYGYVPPAGGLPHTVTTYDALGRVVRVDNPDSTHTETHYEGWTTTAVDENGHQKRYTEDAFGRMVRVNEYVGGEVYTTTYGYDTLGNLTDVWDAVGHHIQVWYNPLGRKTMMDDPDMGVWEYGYDALGNLAWQTDAKGQTLEFEYDALNRLVSKQGVGTFGPNVLAEYGYDDGQWGIGHRTAMTDTTGMTTWAYDVRGRVISETRSLTEGLGTYITQWQYDAAGRLRAVKVPTGEVVRTSYNARGLVRSVTGHTGEDDTRVYLGGASYNALRQVTGMELGNRVTVTHTYHPSNFRLEHIQIGRSGSLLDLQHAYDLVGNVTSISDGTRGETQTFTYDTLDRLLTASGAHAESFTYDTVGNVEIKAGVDYDYADAAHVHAVTHLDSQERYRYDANGNMIRRISGGVTYLQRFDVEGRLRVVRNTTSGAVTTIGYDAEGMRVWQSNGITTTVYVGDLLEITLGPSSRVTRTYYYAGGQRIAIRVHDGEYAPLYYLHGDHLGSTSLATHGQTEVLYTCLYLPLMVKDCAGSCGGSGGGGSEPLQPEGPVYILPPGWPEPGTVVEASETRYTPYGEVRTAGAAVAGLTDFTYTGQQVDLDTGLMFYNARWYDPVLGRFVSPDPLVPSPGNPQGLNRYSYVYNRPLVLRDPSGYDPLGPAWTFRFWVAHGQLPTDEDRQDRLFSLMFPGTGLLGIWTSKDWEYYHDHREALWGGEWNWRVHEEPGLDRFLMHLARLSAYYLAGEEDEFVRAIGLVWGGISYKYGIATIPTTVALGIAGAGRSDLLTLYEGNAGWDERLVDDRNPSRHWAGGFVAGWNFHEWGGKLFNTGREFASVVFNQPGASLDDVWLGNIAAQEANALWHDTHGLFQDDFPKLSLVVRMDEDLRFAGPTTCLFCQVTQLFWNTPAPPQE